MHKQTLSRGGHGPLYAILLLGWLLLTLSGFVYVYQNAYTRLSMAFAEQADAETSALRDRLRANDAVLGGFTGFLAAMKSPSYQQVADYARFILEGNPHVYMLEIAETVPRQDRERFHSDLSASDQPLTIRAFTYDSQREFQTPTEASEYHLITFIWPDHPAARAVIGLDLNTAPHLANARATAAVSSHAVSTTAFKLVEGDLAYVMMQRVPLDRVTGATLPRAAKRVALAVIKADSLIPEKTTPETGRILWTEHESPGSPLYDLPPTVTVSAWERWLLPMLTKEVRGMSSSQPVRLMIYRQMRSADFEPLAWRSVILVSLLAFSLVVIYLRQHHLSMLRQQADLAQARWSALHDPLTGLPNRYLLTDRLHRALAHWRRSGIGFALFFIDLDHFKEINDRHGHDAGDALLSATATRLESVTRETDTIARYAGDEFVVLAAGLTDRDQIHSLAEKIVFAIAQPVDFNACELVVTGSLGVAVCPDDGSEPDALLKAADNSMYRVKRRGRNGVAFSSRSPRWRPLLPGAPAYGSGTPIRLVR